jgi:hypothetical protein
MGRALETALGILNGAVGDYLARTGNGLATEMTLVHDGAPLAATRASFARAYPAVTSGASSRVVVLVHGLMCTEAVWNIGATGGPRDDYGARLAADFGYTPLYVRYNTGLPIADNGAALARLLAEITAAFPAPLTEILLLGFSMGGLVIRAACHEASASGAAWLGLVKRAVYVGTPHGGAPLERAGRVIARVARAIPDPYVQLAAQIGDLRSDGVKDLGDADLRHEDRARRVHALAIRDPEHPVPLLPRIAHYLAAGSLARDPWIAALVGDGLVPVPSGTIGARSALSEETRGAAIPPDRVRYFPGIPHMTLAHHPEVYAQIRAWCEDAPALEVAS